MSIYNPKRRTENGTEEVKFPISAVEGLEDDLQELNSKTVDKLGDIDLAAGSATYALSTSAGIGFGNTYETLWGSGFVNNYIPIVAGENVVFESSTEPETNLPVVKINASDGVDKVTALDTWYGGAYGVDADEEGIYWNDEFAFLDENDNPLKVGLVTQKVPIAAGENVTFSNEGDVVKINASGGGTEIVTTTGTGATYVATVPSITELTKGIEIIIIPHVTSTSASPTLNVNGLGAKNIRSNASHLASYGAYPGYSASWIQSGYPLRLMYSDLYWVAVDFTKPSASDLNGRVAVSNGGVPTATTSNKNQVLTVNSSGTPVWGGAISAPNGLIVTGDSATNYLEITGNSSNPAMRFYNGNFVTVNKSDASVINAIYAYDTYANLWGTWKLNSATISTSWRGAKHDIEDFPEEYSVLFDNLHPVRYKYNDGTSGRYHTGLILDELKTAMDIAGVDSSEFASYCVLDKETGEGGIRYEELVALNIHEIQKLKEKNKQLEQKVSELENSMRELRDLIKSLDHGAQTQNTENRNVFGIFFVKRY